VAARGSLSGFGATSPYALTWLDGLDTAAKVAPFVKKDGSTVARLVGDLMQRVIYHAWFDLGQVAAVRRPLGQEKVPQFVGNIDQLTSYRTEAGEGVSVRPTEDGANAAPGSARRRPPPTVGQSPLAGPRRRRQGRYAPLR
jgi:hypothetical protein